MVSRDARNGHYSAAGPKVPAVSGATQPRRGAFINFLLWYLGCMFVLEGILIPVDAFLLIGADPRGATLIGYGFNVVNILIAAIVAVRCRARLWMIIPAWAIGFLAFLLLTFIQHALVSLLDSPIAWAATRFPFLALVIGGALLLNRWLARRRRAAIEAAASAVFD